MTFNSEGLLEPQIKHAKFLAESLVKNNIAWDGSGTGTGKTYVACSIIRHLGKKFIVVCPKLAIPQWLEVLTKFGLKPEFIINFEKLARGNTPYYKYVTPKVYRKLHNIPADQDIPTFLSAKFKLPDDVLVIIDESHKMKGVESLNAGMLFNLWRQGYMTHLMSATQACTPLDMRAFGFAMGLHDGTMRKFKEFAQEAGAEWVGKWGAQYFDSTNPESMAKLDKVRTHLISERQVGSRLTRRDFGDIFPKTTVVAEAYDMGNASDQIQAVYDEMEAELDRLEQQAENYKEHILAVITKARRQAELLKVPTMVEMASEFHREGKSTVIFVNYHDTIEAIVKRLTQDFNPHLIGQIHGRRSQKERLMDIGGFQLDQKHFMVANLGAGGQSINLHDILGGRPRAGVINPSYSAIQVLQSAGRIDRAHAKSDVFQRFLLAARTIEEAVVRRLHDKNNFIAALNDGNLSDADLIPTDRLLKYVAGMNV